MNNEWQNRWNMSVKGIIFYNKLFFKMNYEWQRDNILWLKMTKQFLKTKQYKKKKWQKNWKIELFKKWIMSFKRIIFYD